MFHSFHTPTTYGVTHKLSNYGFKTHERFFKIDNKSLSYFSSIDELDKAEAISGKVDPKQSIPLCYITKMAPFNLDPEQEQND